MNNLLGFYLSANTASSGDMDDRAPVNDLRLALDLLVTRIVR